MPSNWSSDELRKIVTIEPLGFGRDDSRKLATKLRAALATDGDDFARKVLDDNSPADEQGDCYFPTQTL